MFFNNESYTTNLGQSRLFNCLTSNYYREANVIFFALGITSEKSLQNLQKIYQETMEIIKNMNQKTSCVLIGCKKNLEDKRIISQDVATADAGSQGMHYIETSAKMSRNFFKAAVQLCLAQIKNQWLKLSLCNLNNSCHNIGEEWKMLQIFQKKKEIKIIIMQFFQVYVYIKFQFKKFFFFIIDAITKFQIQSKLQKMCNINIKQLKTLQSFEQNNNPKVIQQIE